MISMFSAPQPSKKLVHRVRIASISRFPSFIRFTEVYRKLGDRICERRGVRRAASSHRCVFSSLPPSSPLSTVMRPFFRFRRPTEDSHILGLGRSARCAVICRLLDAERRRPQNFAGPVESPSRLHSTLLPNDLQDIL